MYEAHDPVGPGGTPAFDWDDDAVRDALRVTVENTPAWPKRPENTPRIEVYPGYLLVEHNTASISAGPKRLADTVATAIERYNRYRTVEPSLAVSGTAYVESCAPGEGADTWINEHGLKAVDGEPTSQSDPAEPDQDDMEGGFWDAVARW
jgi:hypothetical protein